MRQINGERKEKEGKQLPRERWLMSERETKIERGEKMKKHGDDE